MIYGFGVLCICISDLVSDLRFWVYLQHLVSHIVVSVVHGGTGVLTQHIADVSFPFSYIYM